MVVGSADSLPELVPSLVVETDGNSEPLEIGRGKSGRVGAELDPDQGNDNNDSGVVDVSRSVGELVEGSVWLDVEVI